jgi:predicted RNA-binding Zn-ribbon protein involved in translation (DUF1610 family)
MMQRRLNASARPPQGFRILVEKGALPFWEGLGDVDFLCGMCGATLAKNNPKEYPFFEILFRCPQCGSYNRMPE